MIYRLGILICLLAGLSPSTRAQPAPADWPLVVVKGHLTFPLPPSMELEDGTFESTSENGREYLTITTEDLDVWAQPKGLNTLGDKANDARTAGIVIKTERGAAGAYQPLGADVSMTKEQLDKLNQDLYEGFVRSGEESGQMTDLSWGGADVVQLEGTQAIRLRYQARMGPAKTLFVVNTYMVQNYDTMYYVTATYTVDEQEKWTGDLETALNALRFEARGAGE